jgi:outer membrane protein TolC
MKALRLASTLLLVCAVRLPAEEPSPLSFPDALAAARGGNESILAARSEVRQREEEKKAAKGLYFPTVSFAPIYTHLNDDILLDLNPIRDVMLKLHPQVPSSLVPSFEETLFKRDELRLPLTARWPLFTGGRIRAANHAAEARVRDAEAQTRQAEEGVLRSLVRAYFGLRLALEEKAVRAEVLAGLDQHVRDARRLEEEGLIAKGERLNAEVARAEADRQLKRAGHDVEIARAGLANVLAADAAVGDPATPLFVVGDVDPADRFREAALASHPALERLAAQRDLAGEAVAAQKGAFWPEVFAYGLYETRKADLSPIEPEWMAGVGARIELFDGGSRLKKLAAARAQQDRVSLLDRKLRRDLATLVEKQYREAEKAREQYTALDATRALADENLRARTRAFEEGVGTSLEVVDARLAQEKVGLERLAAAYGFVNALAELLEASGQGGRFEEMRTRASAIEVQP